MSSFAAGDTRSPSANPFVPSGDGARDAYMGQQHGRIQVEEQDTNSKMASSRSAGTDISVTQRMISATGGSVLTSLLGKTPSSSKQHPTYTVATDQECIGILPHHQIQCYAMY
jgi:hypothetical protein